MHSRASNSVKMLPTTWMRFVWISAETYILPVACAILKPIDSIHVTSIHCIGNIGESKAAGESLGIILHYVC
jgi:hypothetical protein